MKTTEFNLLDEKWILVRKNDCTVTELSVTDVLLHAHEFKELAGELPTQDISILRLLLAILQTVFSRYTVSGERQDIADEDDAIDRWKELWDAGRFPEKPIREYLAQWHDRFWLFHPERPFYQTNAAQIGTPYEAKKLNGEISESNNKARLFSAWSGDGKNMLTYSEAARWLLYVNNYDDTSSKAKTKEIKLKSPGAGWLGQLGMITVVGENLFETLTLNLIQIDPSNKEAWPAEHPTWELDQPRSAERCEVAMPDNLSELYTLQSRRLILIRDNEIVTGYKLLGGDFFDKKDAFIEPMTIWVKVKGNERDKVQFQPKRHNASVRMWREFASAFVSDESSRVPGVVSWVNYLRDWELIGQKKLIRFQIASVQYGDKDTSVSDIFSDSLTFHTDLLTKIGRRWQSSIANEVSQCDELAKLLSSLARSLEIASGSSRETAGKSFPVQNIREQFYFSVDVPFREWLLSIDPHWEAGSDEEFECVQHWHDTVKTIASRLADGLVKEAGSAAIIGHMVKERDKPDEYYSAPKALGFFKIGLNKLYPKEEHNA